MTNEEIGLYDPNEIRHIDESEPETWIVYPDWSQVPKHLKTKNKWMQEKRQVKKKSERSAQVRQRDGSRRDLFTEAQTSKATPQAIADYKYCSVFQHHCHKDQYSYYFEGEGRWCTDVKGVSKIGYGTSVGLTPNVMKAKFILHNTWIAVKAGRKTRFAVIDLDNHDGMPDELFLKAVRVLYDRYRGKECCHVDYKLKVSGVHFVFIFKDALPTLAVLKEMRRDLVELEQEQPELVAEMTRYGKQKGFGGLEIFPSNSGKEFNALTCNASGIRPTGGKECEFAIDAFVGPLPRLYKSDWKSRTNSIALMNWIDDEQRSYMETDVLIDRLRDLMIQKAQEAPQMPQEATKDKKAAKTSTKKQKTTETKQTEPKWMSAKGNQKEILFRAFGLGDFQGMKFNIAFKKLARTIQGVNPLRKEDEVFKDCWANYLRIRTMDHNLESSSLDDEKKAESVIRKIIRETANFGGQDDKKKSEEIWKKCRQSFAGLDFGRIDEWNLETKNKPLEIKYTSKDVEIFKVYLMPLLFTANKRNLNDTKWLMEVILRLTEQKEREGNGFGYDYLLKLFSGARFERFHLKDKVKIRKLMKGLVEAEYLKIKIYGKKGITATHWVLGERGRNCLGVN